MLKLGMFTRFELHATPGGDDEEVYARLYGATFPFSETLTACGAVWDLDGQAWLFNDGVSFQRFSEALSETARNHSTDLAEEQSPFTTNTEAQTPLRRFLERGANALENEDLLELILSFDHYLTDPRTMSKKLFDEFGSLGAVLNSEPERLTRLEEITPRVHGLLKAAQLLIERVLHENVQQNPIIGSSEALLDFLRARMRHRQREELIVLYMDRKNRLIKTDYVQGTISRVNLYPRDIATRALELFATAVIIAHNHPGGDASPSKEDVSTTQQVHLALQILNINLYDHVIVCGASHLSFRAKGLI